MKTYAKENNACTVGLQNYSSQAFQCFPLHMFSGEFSKNINHFTQNISQFFNIMHGMYKNIFSVEPVWYVALTLAFVSRSTLL